MPVRGIDASVGAADLIFTEKSNIVCIFSEILILRGKLSVETVVRDENCQIIALNFEGDDDSGRAI
jgi:hypothetical protein